MPKNYWMVLTSPENFQVTRELGFTVLGLKSYHYKKVQRIEPGDRILYYVGTDRIFAATATVTSRYSEDRSQTWKKEGVSEWAFKVHIKPEIVLNDRELIDARQLAPRLDYVRRWSPEDWYIAFAQTNLHLLPKKDFILVEWEMQRLKSKRSGRHRPRGDNSARPSRKTYPQKTASQAIRHASLITPEPTSNSPDVELKAFSDQGSQRGLGISPWRLPVPPESLPPPGDLLPRLTPLQGPG